MKLSSQLFFSIVIAVAIATIQGYKRSRRAPIRDCEQGRPQLRGRGFHIGIPDTRTSTSTVNNQSHVRVTESPPTTKLVKKTKTKPRPKPKFKRIVKKIIKRIRVVNRIKATNTTRIDNATVSDISTQITSPFTTTQKTRHSNTTPITPHNETESWTTKIQERVNEVVKETSTAIRTTPETNHTFTNNVINDQTAEPTALPHSNSHHHELSSYTVPIPTTPSPPRAAQIAHSSEITATRLKALILYNGISLGRVRAPRLLLNPDIKGLSDLPHTYIFENLEVPLASQLFIPKNTDIPPSIKPENLRKLFARIQTADIESAKLIHAAFVKKTSGFHNHWINRTLPKNGTTQIWHRLSHDDNVRDTNLYGQYVHAVYNENTSTLNVSGTVCGDVPSLFCLRAMIADALMEQNRSISYLGACSRNFTSPILYNLPRWTVCINIPSQRKSPDENPHRSITTDTFTLTSLALATLLLEDATVSGACRLAMSPVRAIELNYFYTQHPINTSALTSILFSGVDSQRNIDPSTFYDTTMLLSTAIYSGKDPDLLKMHVSSTALSRGTVFLDIGQLHVPRLLRNGEGLQYTVASINMSELQSLDPIALDYLDASALEYLETLADESPYVDDYYTDVPIMPHARRTGLIPLYGV